MHLNTEKIADLIEGRLAPDEDLLWRGHIENCMACNGEVERWKSLVAGLKPLHLKSAPEWERAEAIALFPRAAGLPRPNVRRIIATVMSDSLLQPSFAGSRGAPDARQLALRAEEFDIHIKIWGGQERRELLGQLLPRHGEEYVRAARCHLLREGERLDTAEIDALGEFHFTDVPEGSLSLQIDLPNLTVTVIGGLNAKDAP